MKGTYLGEFQEIVLLTIWILEENAYGVSIQNERKQRLNRSVSRGALHTALTRLMEKGFVKSEFGAASPKRGGRRKRLYTVTNRGKEALVAARDLRESFWKSLPDFSI